MESAAFIIAGFVGLALGWSLWICVPLFVFGALAAASGSKRG